MMTCLPVKRLFAIVLWIFLFSPQAYAGQSTQAAFSPSPEAIALVQNTINHADYSIDLAAYSFTSYKIAYALIEAKQRGVEVRVLLDKAQGKRHYLAIKDLQEAGIPIRINRHYAIMHDKYLIVDDKTVETGSFNYTINAEKYNAENVIVIKNNKKLANLYLANWLKLWNEGNDYSNGS
jgi:phosphatidylserine/phosphatidylglycerophosphate/cardiolipin synthase-like enzyme